jgi:IS30 family transposase
MGRSYAQLSLEDRCEISRLHANGCSIRQIAAAVDRAPSTIAREIRRNSGRQVGYKPSYADEQTRARRWSGSRLEREPELRNTVLDHLRRGWSPEQVAGRLAREAGKTVISYETIYRFIHAQIARTNDYSWRLYLPRAKSKRGFRGRKGGSPASFIKGRIPIAQRPPIVAERSRSGDWEADLILFARYGQAILTLHERSSRVLLATRPPNKAADPIAEQLTALFAGLPQSLRRTVTFDNGTEFAFHYRLHQLAMATFFCDPHAPWQKGSIENAIGRIRRLIPRKTDLATLSDDQFHARFAAYNNTPRKCLDFQTPAELFLAQLLHFECESTFRPSPE